MTKKNYGIYAGAGQDHYEVWAMWEGKRTAKISGHETYNAALEACGKYVAADMQQRERDQ